MRQRDHLLEMAVLCVGAVNILVKGHDNMEWVKYHKRKKMISNYYHSATGHDHEVFKQLILRRSVTFCPFISPTHVRTINLCLSHSNHSRIARPSQRCVMRRNPKQQLAFISNHPTVRVSFAPVREQTVSLILDQWWLCTVNRRFFACCWLLSACKKFPNSNGFIIGAWHHSIAVWRECDTIDVSAVTVEWSKYRLSSFHIPYSNCSVERSWRNELAIWWITNWLDYMRVSNQRSTCYLRRLTVPDYDRSIWRCRSDVFATWRVHNGRHLVTVPSEWS